MTASSSDDLICKIEYYDVEVPARRADRTKDKTELWAAFRLLHSIAYAKIIAFPICIELRERPDLVLKFDRGEPSSIGIEIVEAVAQNDAKLRSELGPNGAPEIRSIPQYRISDTMQDLQWQRNIFCGRTLGIPMMGNSIERNWYDAILETVRKKNDRFKKPGFCRHPENWLLIYDNWSPHAPHSEVDAILPDLKQDLFSSNRHNSFNEIILLRQEGVIFLSG